MLYRLRFDNLVGSILKSCHRTLDQSLEFWPVGATEHWVKQGKSKRWKPIEAAAFGVAHIAMKRRDEKIESGAETQYIINRASLFAREHGARSEVLELLYRLEFS